MSDAIERAELAAGFRRLRPAIHDWLARDLHGPGHDSTRAYADLMFAFAFARLGAKRDTEQLTRVAEVALLVDDEFADTSEAEVTGLTWERWTLSTVRRWVIRMFRFRIQEALSGQNPRATIPPQSLPPRPMGGVNSAGLRVEYVTKSIRSLLRLLEPSDSVDPYGGWTKQTNRVERRIAGLSLDRGGTDLERLITPLIAEAELLPPGERIAAWGKLLPLTVSCGRAFRSGVLLRIPTVVTDTLGPLTKLPDQVAESWIRLLCEMLAEALSQAATMPDAEYFPPLADAVDQVVGAAGRIPRANPSRVLAQLGWECLKWFRCLRGFEEADAFLFQTRSRWPCEPLPDDAGSAQAIAVLAGFEDFLGRHDQSSRLMEFVTNRLTSPGEPGRRRWDSRGLSEVVVAAARVLALRGTDAVESIRAILPELGRINNTFTTANYYSRFHLQILEAVLLAFPAASGA